MAAHPLLLVFMALLAAVGGIVLGRLWERWEQRQLAPRSVPAGAAAAPGQRGTGEEPLSALPPHVLPYPLPTPLLDPVTQLPNAAAILDALARQLSFADRLKHPVTLLIAELDHYDELLARHGEAAVQQILLEVARRMKFRVRTHELLGRWAPNHFLVVLPDVDVGNALVLGEDLREAISGRPVVLVGREDPLAVTISVGVHGRTPSPSRPLRDLAAEMVVGAERALEATVADGPNRLEIEP